MSNIKLRNILTDGPVSLRAPWYNFIYFLSFSLIVSSLILFGFGDQKYLVSLLSENFAPNNILMMFKVVLATLAIHSFFFFPYENYESNWLKIVCIYPANLWLSLLSAASAITVGAAISWFLFGPSSHALELANADIVQTAGLAIVSWPVATVILAALLLPREYLESNEFISIKKMKVLIRALVLVLVVDVTLRLLLILSKN